MAHKLAFLSILLVLAAGTVEMKDTEKAPVLHVSSRMPKVNYPVFLTCYIEKDLYYVERGPHHPEIASLYMEPNDEYKFEVKNTSIPLRCQFSRIKVGQYTNIASYDPARDKGQAAIYSMANLTGAYISYDNDHFELMDKWVVD